MLYKKYLTQYFYLMKCHGVLSLLLPATVYILIPLLLLLTKRSGSAQELLYINFITFTQMLIPLMSVWFLVLVMREYSDFGGNEILYAAAPKTQVFLCVNILFSVVLIIPLYLFFAFYFDNMLFEYLRIAAECVLFGSFSFFIITALNSALPAILAALLYTLMSQFATTDFSYFSYCTFKPASVEILLEHYAPFLLISVIFIAAAVFIKHFVKKYN